MQRYEYLPEASGFQSNVCPYWHLLQNKGMPAELPLWIRTRIQFHTKVPSVFCFCQKCHVLEPNYHHPPVLALTKVFQSLRQYLSYSSQGQHGEEM